MKIKCSGDPKTGMINSGIQTRSLRVPGGHHMSGYQIDCGAGWFGKIYDEFRRNKVIATPVDQVALEYSVDGNESPAAAEALYKTKAQTLAITRAERIAESESGKFRYILRKDAASLPS